MINHLKEQVILKAGHVIKNRGDCENLSRLNEIETGDYLNYNTLRRFFGIDPKKVIPRSAYICLSLRFSSSSSFKRFS